MRVGLSRHTPDGVFLVSACKDGAPMLRDSAGTWLGTFEGHNGAVWDACLNGPATHAFTASADFTAKAFDAFTGSCVATFTHPHVVKSASVSRDSSLLAAGGFAKTLFVHDLEHAAHEPPGEIGRIPFHSSIRCARFVHSNHLVAVALSGTKCLSLIDARTMAEVSRAQLPFEPSTVELSFNGSSFVCAGEHGACIFDADKPSSPIKELQFHQSVTAAAVFQERDAVATGGQDMWVHMCDYQTGKSHCALGFYALTLLFAGCLFRSCFPLCAAATKRGHHGPVHTLSLSEDDSLLASGSEDGTIRLWSV
jgi:serine-threonine kinase receptor-associated protein